MAVTMEHTPESKDGRQGTMCSWSSASPWRTAELRNGPVGLASYVEQRPQRWKQRWQQVVSKLELGQLRFEVIRTTRDSDTLTSLLEFLADLYRLRFRLTRPQAAPIGRAGIDLPSTWQADTRDWNRDGTLRWILTFDGSTPMSIELVREVGDCWECHCAGFDLGVHEADPIFSSLAMVVMGADLEGMRRLVMCDKSREIDPFDWGLFRSAGGKNL